MSSWMRSIRGFWNLKSPEIRQSAFARIIAGGGLYVIDSEPADTIRINAGSTKKGLFDLMTTRPALSPYAKPNFWMFQNDYDINTTNVWAQGAVGSGTPLACQDARGGQGIFTTGGADNDFYQYTSKYEIAKLTPGKDLWFLSGFLTRAITESDIFVGLSARINSGTVNATHNVFDTGAGNRYDAIGFIKHDGDAYIDIECRKNGTATSSAAVATLGSLEETWVGFHVISTSHVEFYIGTSLTTLTYVGTIVDNLPDDEEMAFIFGLRNGEASTASLNINPSYVIQDI